MGTTSLTFTVSGVSELIGQIEKIQSKMTGLDMSMSKAQLSSEMSRVERLVKEASTFANTLYTSLNKIENVNVNKTSESIKKIGSESTTAAAKVTESTNKMDAAMKKSTEAAEKNAKAQKSINSTTDVSNKIVKSFSGSLMNLVTGFASVQTAIGLVNTYFQEHNKLVEEASASMSNYAKVSGQLGQKATSVQQLNAYRGVVDKLYTSGATTSREEATNLAYAMLSANVPTEEIESLIPALRAGLFSSADLSGLIKASGPIRTINKDVTLKQLMSMAMTSSKQNVSDTSKIIQAVSDSQLMSQELGTTLEESFALSDVIAQSTYNADEARTWQKNFTKDVWKKAMARAAFAKMKSIDPNAKTMEGYVVGYDKNGAPIADPNFRMTMTEFGKWAKEYYGSDKNRLKKDFNDIRGLQGALAIMEALSDGRFEKSLAAVKEARVNNLVDAAVSRVEIASPEKRAENAYNQAKATQITIDEAEARFKKLWETERLNYRNKGKNAFSRGSRDFANWSNSTFNPSSYTMSGKLRQMYTSPYLTWEDTYDAIYNYAIANPEFDESKMRFFKAATKNPSLEKQTAERLPLDLMINQARLQVAAGATKYTPVPYNIGEGAASDAFNPEAIVRMAKAAESAADSLNKASAAADRSASRANNYVAPTPGQSGQLIPATL